METRQAYVTKHATQRFKDRMGIPKRSVQKMADAALKHGIGQNGTKGKLNRYVVKTFFEYRKATNIRIHNKFVYLFDENVLITIFHLPKGLEKGIK